MPICWVRRARTIALVCHAWNKAERTCAELPSELILSKRDCSDPTFANYLARRLRSSNKLASLKISASDENIALCASIFDQAPALRVLDFSPLPSNSEALYYTFQADVSADGTDRAAQAEHLLLLLGKLTRLERLRLNTWGYNYQDLPSIEALTSLTDLKVCCFPISI